MQIREELRAELRAAGRGADLYGPMFHSLIEESDDQTCNGPCGFPGQRMVPDLSQVPPFSWAGGAR